MRPNRRLSNAEREQRREQDRKRLHQAAPQLLTAKGWQRWVHVREGRTRAGVVEQSATHRAVLPGGDVRGQVQRPGYQWGIACAKEKAIWIIVPMPIKPWPDDHADNVFDDREHPRVLFKAVPVFDRSQVAPLDGADPAALDPPCEPLTG